MSDLYNELIDELEKNDIFVRYSTIEPKTILYLSEHDKPFKVKIRELEESYQKNVREIRTLEKEVVNYKQAFKDKCADYDVTSELLGKYQRENESLKKRIIELENFSCQAEQETESLVEKLKQRIAGLEKELEEWKEEARAVKKNRDEQLKNFRKAVEPYVDIGHMHETIGELKQRIAELESMETEKPTKINLNDRIKVKLTPLGAEIYYHQYDDVNKKIKENGGTELEPMMPQIDKDGYTEFQLWHFMELYVKHIGMCKPNVIEPLEIIVVE